MMLLYIGIVATVIFLSYKAGEDSGYWKAYKEIRHTLKIDGMEHVLDDED